MASMVDHPHVLVIPHPAQGHVMPLMRFSYRLVDRGFKVTFVAIEEIYAMLVDSLQVKGNETEGINLVFLPDGLSPDERKNQNKLYSALRNDVSAKLEKLIRNLNESDKHTKITCVIADEIAGWALDVARKMGIQNAAFFPAAAGVKALLLHIPKMIETGVIDKAGIPKIDDTIIWSPNMPGTKPAHLPWSSLRGLFSSEVTLHEIALNTESTKCADWVFCNTFYELEPEAIALIPNLLPIGPLLASNNLGNFWTEDLTCLNWLDQQDENSVIYIAFGSIAIIDQHQIEEIATGLEQLRKPFLWVIRTGRDVYGRPSATYPDGFEERVASFGKIVSWAPQQKVLSHRSIACFISHCGWNSSIEGVSMGVPFICWPYFADQFFDATYITDVWKVGLGLKPNRDGIVSKDEFKRKLIQLLADMEIKENSVKLKELAESSVTKGGSSIRNLELFTEKLKHGVM